MPSLDPVQKPQRQPAQKKRVSPPASLSSAGQSQRQGPPRTALMWAMISSLMAVIIIGWIFVLRSRPFSTNSGNGPLRSIVEQITNFFSTARQPAQENPTDTTDEKIDELRSRVFPEFTDTAE